MNQKTRRAAPSRPNSKNGKPSKIPEETLLVLREKRDALDVANAEAAASAADFQLAFVKALKGTGNPVPTSSVCLSCGTIHPTGTSCPECPGPAEPRR